MVILLCGLLVVGAAPASGGRLSEDAPRAARLLAQAEAPPLLAAPAPDPSLLRLELGRLLRRKPSFGLPVSLIATGGGLTLGGVIYLLLSLGSPLAPMAVTVIGVVGVAVGLSLAGFGAVFMVWRVRDREAWAEDVDDLTARLRAAEWAPRVLRPATGALELPLATLARF